MFYCSHCQKIISTIEDKQFSFFDKENNNCKICDYCFHNINSKLKVQIDCSKLVLLKKNILRKTNKTC